MSDLTPPAVILDKSQMAENIGAVARVMANFGLTDLRLVTPRDGWPQERAWATASGADWVLDGVRVFDSVAEAVADLNTVFATTARPRETRQPVRTASVWQVREPLYRRSSGRWKNYAPHLDDLRAALARYGLEG